MQFDNTLPSDIVNFYVVLQRHEHDTLLKIMDIVQCNPDLFGCGAGQSIFASVARTLERIVKLADIKKHTERIMSGEYSRDMWNAINSAETVGALQDALYLICCRLQELESRMIAAPLQASSEGKTDG